MKQDQVLARATRVLAGTLQAGLVVTGLALGASQAWAQTAGSADAQLQGAVQSALAADTQLRGQQITTSVSQGAVTLSGTVADDAQRTAAEQTVAQVSGVKSINDGIGVGSQVAADPQNSGTNQAAAVPPPPADGAAGDEQNQAQNQNQAQASQSGGQAPYQAQPAQTQAQNTQNMPPPPPDDGAVEAGQQGNGQYSQQGGGYPQPQGQYGNQYPQQPGQYAPYPPRGQYPRAPYASGVMPEKQNASGPVTLAPGLLLNVRTSEMLSTGRLKAGEFVQFTAASDVYANGVVALPRGAVLTGQVMEAKNAGPFGGSPKLDLKLTTVTLGNQSYPLVSDVWSSQGPSKTGYTAANTVGGAAVGALIGAVAGGGIGAGIGAVAGGAGGALVSGATHGPRLDLPAEALLQFHLAAPLTVQPVKFDEAQRLAASVPQPPVLRQRPAYLVAPYPYPYYARPYGYPVYYRPY